jgi:hypothetical protein
MGLCMFELRGVDGVFELRGVDGGCGPHKSMFENRP